MSPYRSPVSPMGMVYGIVEGLGSVPIIHILQGLFNVQLLYKRYSRLQIITFLARHVKLVPLDRYLYLEFGSLYRLADFAGQITFNPLPNSDGLPDRVSSCILCCRDLEGSLVHLPTRKILAK